MWPSRTSRIGAASASFEHAYAVAVQLREPTGADQMVIRTGNTVQSFRLSRQKPRPPEEVLTLVA